MNEEEKEAIKTIKSFKNMKWYNHAFDKGVEILTEEERREIDIIINLIEKQQKEIEKLKLRKYILNAETNEIKEIPISDDYVSKDKIKEKIKELEKEYKKYDKEELINLMKITSGKLSALDELLGE